MKKRIISRSWCWCCCRRVHLIFRWAQFAFVCRRSKVCNYICVFAVCFYICAAHTLPHTHTYTHTHTHTHTQGHWAESDACEQNSTACQAEVSVFHFCLPCPQSTYFTVPATPLHPPPLPHILHIRLPIAGRLLLIKNGRQRTAASRQWQMRRSERRRWRRTRCRVCKKCRRRGRGRGRGCRAEDERIVWVF